MKEKREGGFIDKRLEAIKQFFDIATLADVVTDYNTVYETFKKSAKIELEYRNLELSYKDCLKDTFEAALSYVQDYQL